MLRVRFAPSPTGYLHIGSARTFIFNWLYARHNQGVMILRIDDTDVERNTQTSLDSIFDGLKWLDLGWDEFYRQSEHLDLHCKFANEILAKGLAYRDFTPLEMEAEEKNHMEGHWISHPAMRELARSLGWRKSMNPIVFALRHPYTIMVGVLALFLGGGLAVSRMKIDIFPNLNLPVIYVAQPYAGLDPAQMEGLITNYYEYHFLYIGGIHHVESKTSRASP